MSKTTTLAALAPVDQADATALMQGAAILARPSAGVLRLTDSDRHDFLQRMTTNNIAILRAGQSAVTVLTSPVARILYVFTVVARADDLLLLPAPGQAQALARHLRGQIFFMDNVKVHDLSAQGAAQPTAPAGATWSRLRVMGPQAAQILATLGVDAASLAQDATVLQDDLVVVSQPHYEVPGFELVMPTARLDSITETLVSAGAHPISDAAYESRRIELGRPAVGAELVEEYSPLEAGLDFTCADNKGCYTGQEIIARQITYDKVTKTLVGMQLQSAVAVGSEVSVDNRSVGSITSVTHSPTLNAPVALAIVKRPHNAPGTTVEVGGQSATIKALPLVA